MSKVLSFLLEYSKITMGDVKIMVITKSRDYFPLICLITAIEFCYCTQDFQKLYDVLVLMPNSISVDVYPNIF